MEVQKNPLLIPVVLQNLFTLAEFRLTDFRNFRLVCKDWMQASLARWRQEAWLNVYGIRRFTKPGIKMNQYLSLLELDNNIYNLKKHPFRKYNIRNWRINLMGNLHAPKLRFWTTVGPLMESLCIAESDFYNVEDFRKLIFKHTPNLKQLQLHYNIYHFKQTDFVVQNIDFNGITNLQNNLIRFEIRYFIDSYNSNPQFPIRWKELFLYFPKIQALHLHQRETSLHADVDGITELIYMLAELEIIRTTIPDRLPVLKKLHINYLEFETVHNYRSRVVAQFLESLQMPLTDFKLGIGSYTEEVDVMRTLEIHAATLQNIYIWTPTDFLPFTYNFFTFGFPNLHSLKLAEHVFPNLLFVRQMPNLKRLILTKSGGIDSLYRFIPEELDIYPYIEGDVIRRTNFSELEGVVLNSLKYLSVEGILCDREQMERLTTLMPNLKKLQIGLNDDGFEVVARKWWNLEKITIQPFRITEQGLLGTVTRNMYRKANITDLRYLKYFAMEITQEDPNFDWGLTKEAIFHGLFRLDRLTQVTACLSAQVKEEVHDQLIERFSSVMIL
ncbi:unnamed protein product [Orchesella dallaii]|uniref:F-box domain-containing protein n=1 Tax=Orchesella dallaii TaxID=48710 RepID=A0ABP1Q3E5_9HEXA